MHAEPGSQEETLAGQQDRALGVLQDILQRFPKGIREYDLLQECRGKGLPFLEADSLLDDLTLFRVHFLLFHCLYLLQQRLRQRREGDLDIHCLAIILKPWCGEDASLPEVADPLRGYYLDLEHLTTMTRQEVQALIDGFWQKFGQWDQRQEALAVLGLQDPVDQNAVVRRYRQLALAHHPDRGGDAATFRKMAKAMAILRQ